MSPTHDDAPVRPSLLDRLLDDDPGASQDPNLTSRQRLRELQLAIRRDLQDLLNTRERALSTPPELDALRDSVFSYGLPDLASANLADDDEQEELLARIEATVRAHEPRFQSVEVHPVSSPTPGDRTLRFRIQARIFADPDPEEVEFDSAVEPIQRAVEVRPRKAT